MCESEPLGDTEREVAGVDQGGEFGESDSVGEDLLNDDRGAADRRRCERSDERDERATTAQRVVCGNAEDGSVNHGVDTAG